MQCGSICHCFCGVSTEWKGRRQAGKRQRVEADVKEKEGERRDEEMERRKEGGKKE